MLGRWSAEIAALGVAAVSAVATAQSTVGYGPTIVVPLVAHTPSFNTEVFVHNPLAAAPLTVDVVLIEGTVSTAPGQKSCGQVVVPANGSAVFEIATQCALAAGGHFGWLVVQDASGEKLNSIFVYSRTQNPQGIGFSVEGFPAGNLSGQSQRVNGLKRVAAGSPPYQSNCFVGSFERPVDYFIRLKDAGGNNIGNGVSGHLDPNQMIRYLDIFAAAAAVGDFANVSATISALNSNAPGNRDHPLFLSFCTVQDNVSFGADFRMAKSFSAWDMTHQQTTGGCTPADCGAYDYAVPDANHKHVFQLFVRPPDNVKCELKSDRLGELSMRLREPRSIGDCDLCSLPPGSTAAPTTPGAVVAGADGITTSFHFETSIDVIRASDGAALRDWWTLEVGARNVLPAPVGPIPYSLVCRAGNGIFYAAPFVANDDF